MLAPWAKDLLNGGSPSGPGLSVEGPRGAGSVLIVQPPRFFNPYSELRIFEHVYPLISAGKQPDYENGHCWDIFKYKSVQRVTYHTPDGIKDVVLKNPKSRIPRKKVSFTPATDANSRCTLDKIQ